MFYVQEHCRLVPHASSIAADAAVDDSALVDEARRTEDGTIDLMEEMRGCRSIHEIVEVVQDEAANMSINDVTLALYRIGYLSMKASRAGVASTFCHHIIACSGVCLREVPESAHQHPASVQRSRQS